MATDVNSDTERGQNEVLKQSNFGSPVAKIAPPWIEFARKISALFSSDPEVVVDATLDGESKTITLRVDDPIKSEAIARLLPEVKNFGGVVVKIKVVPANDSASVKATLRAAFAGNPALTEIIETENPAHTSLTYGVFEPKIIQFWNDDMSNPDGISSFLLGDLAAEVFQGGNCTAIWTTKALPKKEG